MDIKVGDKVCYSRKFLQSAGILTGPTPFARGEIKSLKDNGDGWILAVVDWGKWEMPSRVNVANLSVVHPDKGILDKE